MSKRSIEFHGFDPLINAVERFPMGWTEARGTFAPHTVEAEGTSYIGSLVDKINDIGWWGENNAAAPEDVKVAMNEIREELSHLSGKRLKEALDGYIPEVFAEFGNAVKETLGFERIYDSQLRTAIAMHDGKVAELPTGEGKTIGIAHAAALNALAGKGVHVITANNYLAARDAANLGAAYDKLGLKVAVILSQEATGTEEQYIYDPHAPGDHPDFPHLRRITREEAYQADITYGMDHAFMTDALMDEHPDNVSLGRKIQRQYIALVDEADDVMVDTAEIPHILGRIDTLTPERLRLIKICDSIARQLKPQIEDTTGAGPINADSADFQVLNAGAEPSAAQFKYKERGYQKIWELLITYGLIEPNEKLQSAKDLFTGSHNELLQALSNAIRAHHIFRKGERDGHYQVKDGKIFLTHKETLQQQTRLMNGMHQALEAKEELEIQPDTGILNQIGVPEYFRRYERIGATTGTAKEGANVFYRLYKMDVVEIPSSVTSIRENLGIQGILSGKKELYARAVTSALKEHEDGRPVIIFATSVEDAETIHQMLCTKLTVKAISEVLQTKGVPLDTASKMATNLRTILHTEEASLIGQRLQLELEALGLSEENEDASTWQVQFLKVNASQRNTVNAISSILQTKGVPLDTASQMATDLHKLVSTELTDQIAYRLGQAFETLKHFGVNLPSLANVPSLAKEFIEIKARENDINLLHATQSADEARIIARAGKRGAITVTTAMAGRGTDIKPGGDFEIPPFQDWLQQWLPHHQGGFHKFLPFEDGGFQKVKSDFDRYQADVIRMMAEQAPLLDEERAQVNELGGPHIIIAGMDDKKRLFRQKIGRTARMGMPGSYEVIASWEDPVFAHITDRKVMLQLLKDWGIQLPPITPEMSDKRRRQAQEKRERILGSVEYGLRVEALLESVQSTNAAQQADRLSLLSEQEDVVATVRKAYLEKLRSFMGEQDNSYVERTIDEVIDDIIAHPPTLAAINAKIANDYPGFLDEEALDTSSPLPPQQLAFIAIQYLFNLDIDQENATTLFQQMTPQEMGTALKSQTRDQLDVIRGQRWKGYIDDAASYERKLLLDHLTLAWQQFLQDLPTQVNVTMLQQQQQFMQSSTFSTLFHLQVQRSLQEISRDMKYSFIEALFAPPPPPPSPPPPRIVPVLTPVPELAQEEPSQTIETPVLQVPSDGSVYMSFVSNSPLTPSTAVDHTPEPIAIDESVTE